MSKLDLTLKITNIIAISYAIWALYLGIEPSIFLAIGMQCCAISLFGYSMEPKQNKVEVVTNEEK